MLRALTVFMMLSLSVVFSASAQGEDCTPASGDPIRLGAVFPQGSLLTVRLAEAYQGAAAMLDAVNGCGGVKGRPVEWVYIPASDREEAANAARTLIEDEGVPLIAGSGGLAVLEGLRSVTEPAGVVLWEVTEARSELVESDEQQWTFATRPTHTQLGIAAVEFAQAGLNLDELRVALIYEDRPRGQAIAEAIRDNLATAPVIEVGYSNWLSDRRNLAERIRDEGVNVVMLGAFDRDADSLWYWLREEDANIAAWIHIGSGGYREDLCSRFGNYDGFISVTATGPVDRDYRAVATGGFYEQYLRAYLRNNSEEPTQRADLSASGVYLLLRHVLPNVQGAFTPENIRQAIIETEGGTGLMGDGVAFANGVNQRPGVIVQQRHVNGFCSIWPESIATCSVQPFPTWRERAIIEEQNVCRDESV